jgi:hypothetical protein
MGTTQENTEENHNLSPAVQQLKNEVDIVNANLEKFKFRNQVDFSPRDIDPGIVLLGRHLNRYAMPPGSRSEGDLSILSLGPYDCSKEKIKSEAIKDLVSDIKASKALFLYTPVYTIAVISDFINLNTRSYGWDFYLDDAQGACQTIAEATPRIKDMAKKVEAEVAAQKQAKAPAPSGLEAITSYSEITSSAASTPKARANEKSNTGQKSTTEKMDGHQPQPR